MPAAADPSDADFLPDHTGGKFAQLRDGKVAWQRLGPQRARGLLCLRVVHGPM
jgi:hypothetical protein